MKLPAKIREQFVEAGREGGKKGMAQITDPQERSERARKAGKASGLARWRKALKVGDEVRVRGHRDWGPCKITRFQPFADGSQAAVLDGAVDGFAWWNIADLVPPAQRGKGSK